jgi:hypothetical protein
LDALYIGCHSGLKTLTLSSILPKNKWFHYSIDYRLATVHLRNRMIDVLKKEMMKNPILAAHLRDDTIFLELNATITNLGVVSEYLGKLGDAAKGGLSMAEFQQRQHRHRIAEIAAVLDLPEFIGRGREVYGYQHFINDASGSLCEIIDLDDEDDPVLRTITENTILLYIEADAEHESHLIRKASEHPKPLYYRPDFLNEAVAAYLRVTEAATPDAIDPDHFVRWVFPRLLASRRPRYEQIARHGYIVSASDVAHVRDEEDFLSLICRAINARSEQHQKDFLFSSSVSAGVHAVRSFVEPR